MCHKKFFVHKGVYEFPILDNMVRNQNTNSQSMANDRQHISHKPSIIFWAPYGNLTL